MSKLTRPAKEGGYLTYVDKVAAGFNAIIDLEVDQDFGTLYTDYNGFIDDNNIARSSLDAHRDLKPGSITNAELSAGITFPGSAVTDLSITLAKLAPGASVAMFQATGGSTAIPLPLGTETMVLELVFTSRSLSPSIYLLGIFSGGLNVSGTANTCLGQLRIDGTAGDPTSGTPLGGHVVNAQVPGSGTVPMTLAVIGATSLAAGSHRVKLTGTVGGALNGVVSSYQLLAIQWA